jgi:hypothetical protein
MYIKNSFVNVIYFEKVLMWVTNLLVIAILYFILLGDYVNHLGFPKRLVILFNKFTNSINIAIRIK